MGLFGSLLAGTTVPGAPNSHDFDPGLFARPGARTVPFKRPLRASSSRRPLEGCWRHLEASSGYRLFGVIRHGGLKTPPDPALLAFQPSLCPGCPRCCRAACHANPAAAPFEWTLSSAFKHRGQFRHQHWRRRRAFTCRKVTTVKNFVSAAVVFFIKAVAPGVGSAAAQHEKLGQNFLVDLTCSTSLLRCAVPPLLAPLLER